MPLLRIKNLVRAHTHNCKEWFAKKKDRTDDNLPLGITIGSMINLDLLEAQIYGKELITKIPDRASALQVSAYMKFHMNNTDYVQFYFDDVDDAFLEVAIDADGNLDTLAYKRIHDEVYLEQDELACWLGNTEEEGIAPEDMIEGHIGHFIFTVPRFPENTREVDENDEYVIHTEDDRALEFIEFVRHHARGTKAHIEPFCNHAYLYAHRCDNTPKELDMVWMQYDRGIAADGSNEAESTELLDIVLTAEDNEPMVNIISGVYLERSQVEILPDPEK